MVQASAPPVRASSATGRLAGAGGEARGASRLLVSQLSCASVADVEPHALGVTYWFDADAADERRSVSVRFTGRRVGVHGKPGRRDRFDVVETVDGVVPGCGPVAVTTRVRNVAAGTWHVTAGIAAARAPRAAGFAPAPGGRRATASTSGSTLFEPVVSVLAPGARVGAWSALVALGAAVALASLALTAPRVGLPTPPVLLLALVASLVGLVGAKLYFVAGHLVKGDLRRGLHLLTGGMCIQGFVIGAVATLAVGAPAVGLPVGQLLDATAPALMFGMTVGRFGCLLGGCCAGRPTGGRWGVWSSDRRLGMRRVPVQVLEAAAALAVGLAALAALGWSPQPPGGVFVGAAAAYTFARQALFSLRATARHTAYGRAATTALSAVALLAAVALAVATR